MDKREVLEKLVLAVTFDNVSEVNINQALTALDKLEKEKMLEYVGEDRKLTQHYDGFDNGFDTGYNQAKAEIRRKVRGL